MYESNDDDDDPDDDIDLYNISNNHMLVVNVPHVYHDITCLQFFLFLLLN